MTERRRIRCAAWHGIGLLLLTGCTPTNPLALTGEGSANTPSLIDAAERVHHFGPVIARPGLKMTHKYRLVNRTDKTIRIVDLVNYKPCCGELKVSDSTLRPRDATDVEVTLSINAGFGPVVHQAAVVTDPPAPGEIVLRTSATAYPALRVERATEQSDALVRGSSPRQIEFRAIATGTVDQPPIDLDALNLSSTVPSRWLGLKRPASGDGSITVHTRAFSLTLNPGGVLGDRRETVALRDGDVMVLDQPVAWTLVSPVTASPKVLVVRRDVRDYRILLRSSDHRAFRVTGFEIHDPIIQGKSETKDTAVVHTVSFRVCEPPRWVGGRGTLIVRTDHPVQQTVDIPVIVLEQ